MIDGKYAGKLLFLILLIFSSPASKNDQLLFLKFSTGINVFVPPLSPFVHCCVLVALIGWYGQELRHSLRGAPCAGSHQLLSNLQICNQGGNKQIGQDDRGCVILFIMQVVAVDKNTTQMMLIYYYVRPCNIVPAIQFVVGYEPSC